LYEDVNLSLKISLNLKVFGVLKNTFLGLNLADGTKVGLCKHAMQHSTLNINIILNVLISNMLASIFG